FFLTSNEALFSITDTESKRSSGWLKIGQSFGDYTVVSFDREHEVIRLKHGDQSLELSLRESKVKDGKMTISGEIVLGPNDQIEGIHASLFLDEEAVFVAKDGATLFIKAKRRPDGNIRYDSRFLLRNKEGTEE